MNTAQAIEHYRIKRGLSQRGLAAKLGWSKDRIWRYEAGRTPLSVDSIRAIAQALAISPGKLLGDAKSA